MSKPPNYGHLSEVPIKGHTKEWFKRDIETIKNSVRSTAKAIFLIGLFTFLATAGIYYLITFRLDLFEIVIYSLIFWPVVVLGYFLLHVMKTKGYDIRTP
ncbi:hypothetical protein ISS85_01865 [Candidatus Microgenomates bacterium]|nr:hypothetical protein [Candidatus Microgenomates bacterium]